MNTHTGAVQEADGVLRQHVGVEAHARQPPYEALRHHALEKKACGSARPCVV